MNGNISNGGLILRLGNQKLFTDIASYSGTYLIKNDLMKTKISDGLFWFMNADDDYIYYSDQKNGHHLYRFCVEDRSTELLMSKACYGLTLKEDWLYFIDETDQKLYKCFKDGSGLTKIMDEKITTFTLEGDFIWYCTANGNLKRCALRYMKQDTILNKPGVGLMVIRNKVVFANKDIGYKLCIYDSVNQTLNQYDDIEPGSINSDGEYIYCSNRNDDLSMYRINIEDNTSIRFCGDKTDLIHIVDKAIFFCNQEREWYKVSFTGGQATKFSR